MMRGIPVNELIERFGDIVIAGGVSIVGGAVAYVFKLTKTKEEFRLVPFFYSIIIAFFVGNVIGSLLPKGLEYRDGIILIFGFLSYPFLIMLERDGLDYVKAWLPFYKAPKKDEADDK